MVLLPQLVFLCVATVACRASTVFLQVQSVMLLYIDASFQVFSSLTPPQFHAIYLWPMYCLSVDMSKSLELSRRD